MKWSCGRRRRRRRHQVSALHCERVKDPRRSPHFNVCVPVCVCAKKCEWKNPRRRCRYKIKIWAAEKQKCSSLSPIRNEDSPNLRQQRRVQSAIGKARRRERRERVVSGERRTKSECSEQQQQQRLQRERCSQSLTLPGENTECIGFELHTVRSRARLLSPPCLSAPLSFPSLSFSFSLLLVLCLLRFCCFQCRVHF